MLCIFVFYSETIGAQNLLTFSKENKHIDLFMYDTYNWTVYRFGRLGIQHQRSIFDDADQIIAHLTKIRSSISNIICVEVFERAKFKLIPLMFKSCNEVIRQLSAVDIGWTFNPQHFYKKLIKYDTVRNYKILYRWRRIDGCMEQS